MFGSMIASFAVEAAKTTVVEGAKATVTSAILGTAQEIGKSALAVAVGVGSLTAMQSMIAKAKIKKAESDLKKSMEGASAAAATA